MSLKEPTFSKLVKFCQNIKSVLSQISLKVEEEKLLAKVNGGALCPLLPLVSGPSKTPPTSQLCSRCCSGLGPNPNRKHLVLEVPNASLPDFPCPVLTSLDHAHCHQRPCVQERGPWVDPESQSSHTVLSCVTSDRVCGLARTQFYYPITSFNNRNHIMDRDEN